MGGIKRRLVREKKLKIKNEHCLFKKFLLTTQCRLYCALYFPTTRKILTKFSFSSVLIVVKFIWTIGYGSKRSWNFYLDFSHFYLRNKALSPQITAIKISAMVTYLKQILKINYLGERKISKYLIFFLINFF